MSRAAGSLFLVTSLQHWIAMRRDFSIENDTEILGMIRNIRRENLLSYHAVFQRQRRQRREAAGNLIFGIKKKPSTAQPRPQIQIPENGIGPVHEINEHDVLVSDTPHSSQGDARTFEQRLVCPQARIAPSLPNVSYLNMNHLIIVRPRRTR